MQECEGRSLGERCATGPHHLGRYTIGKVQLIFHFQRILKPLFSELSFVHEGINSIGLYPSRYNIGHNH